MREAGLNPEKAPTTFAEWKEMLTKLTDTNGGRLFDEKGRPTFTEKPVLGCMNEVCMLTPRPAHEHSC
jgi:hypothetical protein